MKNEQKIKVITVKEVIRRQRLKSWLDRFSYKPNYKVLVALAGVGLIGLCVVTPGTNWAILIIFPGFVLQRVVNYDKLREGRIGKLYTKLKFKLRW